jgi:hypothetical protein
MSEEERFDTEESDDVEAHRRRALADEPAQQEEDSDDGDDVEAHRRRA